MEEQRFSFFRFQSFSEVLFLIEDISHLYLCQNLPYILFIYSISEYKASELKKSFFASSLFCFLNSMHFNSGFHVLDFFHKFIFLFNLVLKIKFINFLVCFFF